MRSTQAVAKGRGPRTCQEFTRADANSLAMSYLATNQR